MKDENLGHSDPEDFASLFSSNGDDLQQASADTKGKQKVGLGLAASHLEASTKLVVNAISTSREIPNLTSEFKLSSGSGGLGSLSRIAGESSSYKSHQQTLFEQSRRATNECQNDLFDTFTKCSTNALANDGYYVDVSESPFADQEASDGLAVLELLSEPRNEALETTLYQEHDFHTSTEDELWNEAVVGALNNQEDQLDFTPDFITRPELSQQAAPYLGTGNIQETSSTWLGYWNDVFTTYNARVWGNSQLMTSLGISGHNLQQERGSNEPAAIDRALGRLKLIFHHLKG